MRATTTALRALYGCGRLRDAAGAPLRPGGLALTEELIERAGFLSGDTVVDVGCGQGASTRLLTRSGVAAVGVDIDLDLAVRTNAPPPPLVAADAARLPLRDESVDGVLAECSLTTMADPARALVEWLRVLKPGGRLALSDVYSRGGVEVAPFMTEAGLTRSVAAAGFSVERFEDRSEALKRWVAEFIFAYGSLDALCCEIGRASLPLARPGYCLVIARKPEGRSMKATRDV